MRFHFWWLAIVATVLTPWIGPHVDRYVPAGWVLLRGGVEDADRGFWIIAVAGAGLVFLAWFTLFRWVAGRVFPGARR